MTCCRGTSFIDTHTSFINFIFTAEEPTLRNVLPSPSVTQTIIAAPTHRPKNLRKAWYDQVGPLGEGNLGGALTQNYRSDHPVAAEVASYFILRGFVDPREEQLGEVDAWEGGLGRDVALKGGHVRVALKGGLGRDVQVALDVAWEGGLLLLLLHLLDLEL